LKFDKSVTLNCHVHVYSRHATGAFYKFDIKNIDAYFNKNDSLINDNGNSAKQPTNNVNVVK